MTSPVLKNFGHIKESGVLILTKEDSEVKHKRNAKLAGLTFAAVFSLGVASMYLDQEVDKEKSIRKLGKTFPELPYSKCVELEEKNSVVYKGKRYTTADTLTDADKKMIDKWQTKVIQDRRDPEDNFDPYPYTGMAWGGPY